MKIILQITKGEAFKMREMGYGKYVKKTYSSKPHYYLVEDNVVLRAYHDYQKSSLVK